jgi:hypothetical protein
VCSVTELDVLRDSDATEAMGNILIPESGVKVASEMCLEALLTVVANMF